jgi:hypothetical protein
MGADSSSAWVRINIRMGADQGLSYLLLSSLLFILLLVVIITIGDQDQVGGYLMPSKISEKEHAFWRALILPQEERHRLTTAPWDGKGYRWFRSPNIIPIEQWRKDEELPKLKVG